MTRKCRGANKQAGLCLVFSSTFSGRETGMRRSRGHSHSFVGSVCEGVAGHMQARPQTISSQRAACWDGSNGYAACLRSGPLNSFDVEADHFRASTARPRACPGGPVSSWFFLSNTSVWSQLHRRAYVSISLIDLAIGQFSNS